MTARIKERKKSVFLADVSRVGFFTMIQIVSVMMKLWFCLLSLFLLTTSQPVMAEDMGSAETGAALVPSRSGGVTVRISGVRNTDGFLTVALFSAKKGFPGKFDKAVKVLSISASASPVVVFQNVPWGTYAVAVRHDENGNGKLDANFLGMPKEGVGTSNNPKSSFGPPSFKDAAFVLEQPELELNVKLRYL